MIVVRCFCIYVCLFVLMGFSTKLLLAVSIFTNNCCSSYYKEYKLPDDRETVCAGKFKPKVLSLNYNQAFVVSFGVDQSTWSGKSDFFCILHIKAPHTMGVVAVVQEMSLRKNVRSVNCTDFMQFRHSEDTAIEKLLQVNLYNREPWNPQLCGVVEALKEPDSPTDDLASHAFVDPKGNMEVKLFVARKKLKTDEKVFFRIAFTAFLDCKNETDDLLDLCSPNICLHRPFFKDKIINCPQSKCIDEQCTPYNSDETLEKGMSTVIVSAGVLSVMVSFLLFLGCIMLCRYMDFCWSTGGSRRGNDRGTELSQVEPSAPSETQMPSPDKDLPPSYEMLFPER